MKTICATCKNSELREDGLYRCLKYSLLMRHEIITVARDHCEDWEMKWEAEE